MPELPEVEILRRQLDTWLPGRLVIEVEANGARWADAHELCGLRFGPVGRHGKVIVIATDAGVEFALHLGMTGQVYSGGGPRRHERLTLHLDDGTVLRLVDARGFGYARVQHPGSGFGHGPDLLDGAFTAEHLASVCRSRTAPVKAVLLDQANMAGIGNYLADEALGAARIHPATPAGALDGAQLRRLYRAVLDAARSAIDNGGTSMRDYVQLDGVTGSNQNRLRFYGRAGEPCFRCRTPLRHGRVAGRGTTWCEHCQPI